MRWQTILPTGGGGGGTTVVGISDVLGTEPIVVTSPSPTTRNVALNGGIPGTYTQFPAGVMASLARRRVGWTVSPGTGGVVSFAQTATATVASSTNPGVTNADYFTSAARVNHTSAAPVNSRAGICWTINPVFRGNVANTGGFLFEAVFAFVTTTATSRFFCGLQSGGTLVTLATDPSNLTDCVGIGFDSADSNFQWMHNGSIGVCTKVDLGATFPKPTGAALSRDVYQLIMACAPNVAGTAQDVAVFLCRRDDETVSPDSRTLSSNLPTASTALNGHWAVGNGPSSAVAVVGSFMRQLTETTL